MKLDKETFTAQVIAHQDAMFRIAVSILKNDADAEDAVQEAICAAFANRSSLRDLEKFKPWIFRILTNKCYEFCRRQKTLIDLSTVAEILPAAEKDIVSEMTLWQAVMTLSDDLRAAVVLFYYDAFSVREIAAILHINEGAVKTRLSRGRARLRELIKND